jgi:hypothetical protein
MGTYYNCKCGNHKEGNEIRKCDKCGKIYCRSCAYNSDIYHLFDVCPNLRCKHYGFTILGWIEKRQSNNKSSYKGTSTDTYSYNSDSNSSSSGESSTIPPIITIILGIVGVLLGGRMIYWCYNNFANAASNNPSSPTFLEAFSLWILIFGGIGGLIVIFLSFALVWSAIDEMKN